MGVSYGIGGTAWTDAAASARVVNYGANEASWPWWAVELDIKRLPVTRAEVEKAYRAKAKSAHPDRGGSTGRMQRLNEAKTTALKFAAAA